MNHRMKSGALTLSLFALASCSNTAGLESSFEESLTLDVAMIAADATIDEFGDMGQLFGLFARRYEKVKTPVARPVSMDDPCLDDLNDDGKVDGGDIAYGCLLLLESKPSAPCSDRDDETEETPDCDNREPCV